MNYSAKGVSFNGTACFAPVTVAFASLKFHSTCVPQRKIFVAQVAVTVTMSLPLIGCFDDTCLRVDPTSFIGETIYRMRHQSDNRETIHTFACRSPIIEVILIPEEEKTRVIGRKTVEVDMR